MRFYDVAVASLAIDAPLRWTDNLLSMVEIEGVIHARRGVSRRIPHAALLVLAAARELHVAVGLAVRDAVRLAPGVLAAGEDGAPVGGHLRVTLNRPALEAALAERLRNVLESAPTPRRGRPPRRAGGVSA
jgi:hypothetical protein